MNVEIVPNEEEEEEVEATESQHQPQHHQHDEGTTTTTATVIENIDSILHNSNASSTADNNTVIDNNDDDDEGISAAISDDTSATSLASTLSDGISRPRSASLHLLHSASSTPSGGQHPTTTGNNNGRPSSIPRVRPRSNPRTRTPMRQASPLLVISPIVVANNTTSTTTTTTATPAADTNEENERLIRSIFHTTRNNNRRGGDDAVRRRARASSIPEEEIIMVHDDDGDVVVDADEEDYNNVASSVIVAATVDNNDSDDDDDGVATAVNIDDNQARNAHNDNITSPSSTTNTTTTTTTTTTAGRFFTQAVASTSSTRRRNNHRTTTDTNNNTHHQQRTLLSTKQNPSHRKIRRWKNDAFIGTPSEHVHTMLLLLSSGDNNNDNNNKRWNTFPYMPNHPFEYTSEFQKLSEDTTKGGEKVRERFVRGEVASGDDVGVAWRTNHGEHEEEEGEGLLGEEARMYQRIITKCHQLGISSKQQLQLLMNDSDDEKMMEEWGKVLYNKLGMRIQSVLSRSCSSMDTTASGIVDSFESYLVSLALHSLGNTTEKNDVVGFPPLQSQVVYNVFNDILASPPRIVIRNKQQQQQSSCSFNNYSKQRIGKVATAAKEVSDMNQFGVLIPTVHFYFPTDDGQDGSGSKRSSSAFHRILLYAVCQFHGLGTSSSFVVPEEKKKKVKNDGRRKGRRKKQTQVVKGVGSTMRVVTVQGGVLLAPSVKLLDFVCTC